MRNLEDLLDTAQAHRISVRTVRLDGPPGRWVSELRLIQISDRLTRPQATAALAHELAHAHYGHRGHQDPRAERLADETAAHWVIDWESYARAEALVGPHPAAIAAELEVTPGLVAAWARTWRSRTVLSVGWLEPYT